MNKITTIITILIVILIAVGVFLYSSEKAKEAPEEEVKLTSQEIAINTVIKTFPQLAAYKTTSLPPSSIEAIEKSTGWYVAFIQSGSGVPGILHAECYQVRDTKSATLIGMYNQEGDKVATSVNLETCEPIFEETTNP